MAATSQRNAPEPAQAQKSLNLQPTQLSNLADVAEGAAAGGGAPLAGRAPGKVESFADLYPELQAFLYSNSNPTLANLFAKFELQTGAKREHLAFGVGGLLALYLIVGTLAQFVCNLIGFGYPAYASVKAIRTEGKDDDTQWLTYWTVFASFSLLDAFAESIMHVFPVYYLAKALFFLYLAMPQTRGAHKLYLKYVAPSFGIIEAYFEGKAPNSVATAVPNQ